MWNDALMCKGRQNRTKCIIIGIAVSVGVLLVCVLSAFSLHPGLWLQGLRNVEMTQWIPLDCSPYSRTFSSGNSLYFTEGHGILRYENGINAEFEFSELPCFASGDTALGYVPGEKGGMLLSGSGKWVSVDGTVDAVITGKDAFGVILSGSGYLTNTVIYDLLGNKLLETGFVEEAMADGCFPGENRDFAALTFGTDGLWRVRCYSQNGELLWQYPFQSGSVPEMLSLGDRTVLITDEEIMMFDDTGESEYTHSFGVWEPCLTASGREILAIVIKCRGEYRMITVSARGEVLGQWELSVLPVDIVVSGGQIYVLDPGNLHVYDAFGNLRLSSSEGARAGGLEASENCVWLIGNGELMQIENS